MNSCLKSLKEDLDSWADITKVGSSSASAAIVRLVFLIMESQYHSAVACGSTVIEAHMIGNVEPHATA